MRSPPSLIQEIILIDDFSSDREFLLCCCWWKIWLRYCYNSGRWGFDFYIVSGKKKTNKKTWAFLSCHSALLSILTFFRLQLCCFGSISFHSRLDESRKMDMDLRIKGENEKWNRRSFVSCSFTISRGGWLIMKKLLTGSGEPHFQSLLRSSMIVSRIPTRTNRCTRQTNSLVRIEENLAELSRIIPSAAHRDLWGFSTGAFGCTEPSQSPAALLFHY